MRTVSLWIIIWYCFSVLFQPATAFIVPSTARALTRHDGAAAKACAIEGSFTIERVSNRHRALDVLVFRGFSISAEEYQQKMMKENQEKITDDEALRRLTCGIDDSGRDTRILGGPVVTFVAICGKDDCFCRTHGVVATVDAKLNEDHVYLKNLSVDERVRRRGLASLLVTALKMYAETAHADKVILHVERQNVNAIALYEKEGFVFAEEHEGDGRMIFVVSD